MRLALIFAAAYCLNLVFHELAHALTAAALGVPATLYHFYVNIDTSRATLGQRAWIAAVGPAASLAAGLVAWFARSAVRVWRPHSELRVLFVAIFGISFGLGNLVSAAFGGDVSMVMQLFGVPMPLRYATTGIAAIALAGFNYVVGRELSRWAAADATRAAAVWSLVVIPAAVGTTLVIVMNLPMPAHFVLGWISPTVFWAFVAAGVLHGAPRDREAWGGRIRVTDVVWLLGIAIILRLLTAGITLAV